MLVLLAASADSDRAMVLVFAETLAVIGSLFTLWYGATSFHRYGAVSRRFSLKNLKYHINQVVTVCGAPEPIDSLIGPTRAQVLWYEQLFQEYTSIRTSGHFSENRRPSWQLMDYRTGATDFRVRFEDGGRILVRCKPTEIQDMPTRTSSPGLLSKVRTIHRWLPVYPYLTVTGKLVVKNECATIVPDRRHGLFISRHDPVKAAAKIREKGIACFLVAAMLLALAVLMFYSAVSA